VPRPSVSTSAPVSVRDRVLEWAPAAVSLMIVQRLPTAHLAVPTTTWARWPASYGAELERSALLGGDEIRHLRVFMHFLANAVATNSRTTASIFPTLLYHGDLVQSLPG